jgi:hypothetical protein
LQFVHSLHPSGAAGYAAEVSSLDSHETPTRLANWCYFADILRRPSWGDGRAALNENQATVESARQLLSPISGCGWMLPGARGFESIPSAVGVGSLSFIVAQSVVGSGAWFFSD